MRFPFITLVVVRCLANGVFSQIVTDPVKVAAFNIQILGQSKLDKTEPVKILVEILKRYDIALIQEIRDSLQTAFPELINLLNAENPSDPYKYVMSKRLGRSNSKEQYAYIYRSSRVTLKDVYQYEDGVDDGTDDFEREPFAVRFSSQVSAIKDFAIIGIHTKPTDAVKEIDKLTKVYDRIRLHWNLEDIIITGDMNADCSYVPKYKWASISLKTDPRFQWLLANEIDTTVGSSDCSYDRFVIAGSALQSAIVENSAKVYNFQTDLGLTKEEALLVSDHYPIELEIAAKEYPCSEQTSFRFLPTVWCNEIQTCYYGRLMPGTFHCDAGEMFDISSQRCLPEKDVDCGMRLK